MSAAPVENMKNIHLKTKDDQILVVPLQVAKKSAHLDSLIQDRDLNTNEDIVIPLPNVESKQLKKIIGFLENHMDDTSSAEEYHDILSKGKVNAFDADFIKMDNDDMISVYLAAHWVGCDNLKELCAHGIAATMKGKTSNEMNKLWKYENDHTPEEIEKIRAEKAWIVVAD